MSIETLEITEVEKLAPISKIQNEIDRMQAEFLGLKIIDVNDRIGFEKVNKARKEVKSYRVQVEKDRKALVDDAVKWQRQVNDFARGITNQLIEIEEPLQQMEDAHLEEKERLKQGAERKRREKIQSRAQVITSISGVQYNGVTYSLRNALLSQSDLEQLSDDSFQSKVEEFEAEYQVALSERLEAERIAKEEQDRLEAIRKEQEAAAAEIKRQQEELEAEKKRLADEKAAHEAQLKREQEEKEEAIRQIKLREEDRERQIKRQQELEAAKKEAAEQALKDAELKAQREAQAKLEADRLAKEKEAKRLAKRPDVEKFKDMTDKIFAIMDEYTFNTPEGIQAFSEFEHAIAQLVSKSTLVSAE